MKSKVAILLLAAAVTSSSHSAGGLVSAVSLQNHNLNNSSVDTDKKHKHTKETKNHNKQVTKTKEQTKTITKTTKKENKPDNTAELSIKDEIDASTFAKNFSGADESDVIENIYDHYAKHAKDAEGKDTEEQVVFKEDALKAGAEVIEALKGIKGKKLESYMKQHFEEAWKKIDINEEGTLALNEVHTFQRSLMGKLNQFSMAAGTVGDVTGGALGAK